MAFRPLRRRREHGLTLVEVAVALAIATILAVAAVPSLADWVRQARVQRAVSDLQRALVLARSTAVLQNRTVTVTLDADGFEVQAPATGTRAALPVLSGGFGGLAVTASRSSVSFDSRGWAGSAFTADVYMRDGSCAAGPCRRLQLSAGGALRACDPQSTQEALRCL